MAKKKQTQIIPFTEEGMRTFTNVKSALNYFEKNGNVSRNKIISLFQNTFMIVSGKYSVNVIDLQNQKSESLKLKLVELFKNEPSDFIDKLTFNFENKLMIWKNKFKVTDETSEV